ncbi:hypothetical protein GCM10009832_26670 [Dietzia kunjamensis subsp. schimae]
MSGAAVSGEAAVRLARPARPAHPAPPARPPHPASPHPGQPTAPDPVEMSPGSGAVGVREAGGPRDYSWTNAPSKNIVE